MALRALTCNGLLDILKAMGVLVARSGDAGAAAPRRAVGHGAEVQVGDFNDGGPGMLGCGRYTKSLTSWRAQIMQKRKLGFTVPAQPTQMFQGGPRREWSFTRDPGSGVIDQVEARVHRWGN